MAVSFNIPPSPKIHVYQSDKFLGADFTSDASTVDDTKSPNCENMIRSVPGKVRKRMGYHKVAEYGAQVYGVHKFSTTDEYLVHAGDKLYKWGEDTPIYEHMAEHRSVAFELNMKLFILDGTALKVYDGTNVSLATDLAYIPTLTIAKDHTGGGTDYEPLNLLQPAFIELFYVKQEQATVKDFQLTFGDLDDTPVKAWVMASDGSWTLKEETTDFTVDRQTGKVTFLTAPGASPVTGEDNVKIQAYRTVEGYADRINHCTIGALFGVNGAGDRLFISGNSDKGIGTDGKLFSYINYDWFSQQYDPTYYGDTWYSKLGSDASAIMGYSIINNYLAAHKDGNETSQSVLIRQGDLVDGKPSFKLINTLQGAGAISKYCFAYLETEPVFLSDLGVYAVTAQDITGEKYAQDRSYYLEGKLLQEDHLEDAIALTWKDYYILCINSHCYILDGLQPIHTDKSRPYATRQYVGFYFTNIPAYTMFVKDNDLYFGDTEGNVYAFYKDEKAITSYNDEGKPIYALWETADIAKDLFYKNKTYRYIAVRCMPEVVSSIQVWAQRNGIWQLLKYDETTLKYFSFRYIVFSKFTFSTNRTQKVTSTKARLKKLDHVRFRFINDSLNEPLGINDFAVEFTQNGNHK